MIAVAIIAAALLGTPPAPRPLLIEKASHVPMPSSRFIEIRQERDMGGYWQTEANIAPACRLMLTFRPAPADTALGYEVVSRECPQGPLANTAFWRVKAGKVQFLDAAGQPIALYGLTHVDRIAPATAGKGLHPMIRGYIS